MLENSQLVGALSPVNHIGLYQGYAREQRIALYKSDQQFIITTVHLVTE